VDGRDEPGHDDVDVSPPTAVDITPPGLTYNKNPV
jgi:hypothetical protein